MTQAPESQNTRRTKGLALIAAGGLGIGVLALGVIAMLTAGNLGPPSSVSLFTPSCSDNVPDSGPTERTLAWSGRDRVDIKLPSDVTVHYRRGEGNGVIVRGAARDIAFIEVNGSEIRSTCRQSFSNRVDITLPGQVFRKVSLKGSGKVIMESVDQADLDVSLAGGGTVSAQGRSTTASISIAGSGEVKLDDLALEHLTASIAGSGTVDAAPKEAAEISIAGSGEVRLSSRPADMSTSILGSGRVTYISGP